MSKSSGKTDSPHPAKPDPSAVRRPPTMRQVAELVGVHQTTVSLALRNHPSIPRVTRDRIRAAAAQLGYRPNPLLSAFNFHRVTSHPAKGAPTIAMVFDGRMHPRSPEHEYPRQLFEAAREAAAGRGYGLEAFVLEEDGLTARRLARVLATRGTTGVILSTLSRERGDLELDWARFCAVKIESLHVAPGLNAVSTDQWQATRLGLRQMRALGYRRVGLVAARDDEERLGEPFRTGMLVEELSLPAGDRVPALLFSGRNEPHLDTLLAKWVREHAVEAVLSNWNNVIDLLRRRGHRVPQDVAVASLDVPERNIELAGVVQNHRVVGRQAVEQVATLLQTHQRGLPLMPSLTFVPGRWRDGASAPRRFA